MSATKAIAVAVLLIAILSLLLVASVFLSVRAWWRIRRTRRYLRQVERQAYRERYGAGQ